MMDILPFMACLLTNPWAECTLMESDQAIYKQEDLTWEQYADEVRRMMSIEFGFELYDGNYYEKMKLEKKYLTKLKDE